MTVREMISRSLRLIGVLAVGETATADELTDGISTLTEMIDDWNNEGLMIYHKALVTHTLVASQASYTVGASGADITTTRPLKIEDPSIRDAAGNNDFSLKKVSQREYEHLTTKDTETSIPRYIFVQDSHPLMTLTLWPVPNEANTLRFYAWQPLQDLSDADTVIALPPGYLKAIRSNLALELAPEYGKPTSPELQKMAMDAKANIKRINIETFYSKADDASQPTSQTWNWLTGE